MKKVPSVLRPVPGGVTKPPSNAQNIHRVKLGPAVVSNGSLGKKP